MPGPQAAAPAPPAPVTSWYLPLQTLAKQFIQKKRWGLLRELLRLAAGATLTCDRLHSWYPQECDPCCPKCGGADSIEHRIVHCPAVAAVRRQHVDPSIRRLMLRMLGNFPGLLRGVPPPLPFPPGPAAAWS